MKIAFVYEHFFPPFDEGVKNLAEMIQRELSAQHEVSVVRYLRSLPNVLNSLLLVPRVLTSCLVARPDKLIFIPQASLTFSSFTKIFVLRRFVGDALVVIGTQRRVLAPWQRRIVKRMRLHRMFTLSTSMAADLASMNIESDILLVGIDADRYKPALDKKGLRAKYGIDQDRRVLLHVGHIRESRNIDWLRQVAQSLPDWQVVLVGSTSTESDDRLGRKLEDSGAIVIRRYLANIEEIYQLADVYCFPVVLEDAAMETPLSILEAMATNLPILTTPFGRLPEQFAEDVDYKYVSDPTTIVDLLKGGFGAQCNNRAKTQPYTWEATVEKLLVSAPS